MVLSNGGTHRLRFGGPGHWARWQGHGDRGRNSLRSFRREPSLKLLAR
jgi:hypothetical protein